MNAFRLATIVLWSLACVASGLGMAAPENSFTQGFLFAIAAESGLAGLVTFIIDLTDPR